MFSSPIVNGQLPCVHTHFALQDPGGSQIILPKQGGHDHLGPWRDLLQAAIEFVSRACSVTCNMGEPFPLIPIQEVREELKESGGHFSVTRKKNKKIGDQL